MLFRMVPKPNYNNFAFLRCFRAVLFRMVPKPVVPQYVADWSFRAVLFRMVPKPGNECFEYHVEF